MSKILILTRIQKLVCVKQMMHLFCISLPTIVFYSVYVGSSSFVSLEAKKKDKQRKWAREDCTLCLMPLSFFTIPLPSRFIYLLYKVKKKENKKCLSNQRKMTEAGGELKKSIFNHKASFFASLLLFSYLLLHLARCIV